MTENKLDFAEMRLNLRRISFIKWSSIFSHF